MKPKELIAGNLVPMLFASICLIGLLAGELRVSSVSYEVGERVFRNFIRVTNWQFLMPKQAATSTASA